MLTALLLLAPPTTINPEPVQTIDLGKLSWHEARRLDGRPVRVSFIVESIELRRGGALVEAESADRVVRTVWFPPDCAPGSMASGDTLTVEGRVRTRIVPARVIDGEHFREVWDLEIVEARRVGP